LLTVILGILLVSLLAMAGAAFLLYRADWIAPGMVSMGVDLSGMSVAEAQSALTAYWSQQRINVDGTPAELSLSPEELGIALDVQAITESAYRRSREFHSPSDIEVILTRMLAAVTFNSGSPSVSWQAPTSSAIEPIWHFDPSVAAATLRNLAIALESAPQDAAVRVVSGRVEAVPAVEGRALDLAKTLAAIESGPWQVVGSQRLSLVVVQLTPAITDTTMVVEAVGPLLADSVRLALYDPIRNEERTWEIQPVTLGGWLEFRADPADPARLTWALDRSAVEKTLAEDQPGLGEGRFVDAAEASEAITAAALDRSAVVRLRIYHQEQSHIVVPGETLSSIALDYGIPYPYIMAANPELGATLLAGFPLTIPSPDILLPLTVVEDKRVVVSLAQQRLRAYEQGDLKWEWPISSGLPSSPTSPGVFQVQSHEENAYAANWDLWMPWFMGIYRPVPNQDFMNGFHGFPSRDQHQLLWTDALGRRVTYGCILMSTENAQKLYEWAEPGVVVEVRTD
jgi:lipoprotein-anchoring transpeptidase ErfK/SrfK